jgi:hypothetical protein
MLDEGAPGEGLWAAAQEPVDPGARVDRPDNPPVVFPTQPKVSNPLWLTGAGRQDGLAEQLPDEQDLAG